MNRTKPKQTYTDALLKTETDIYGCMSQSRNRHIWRHELKQKPKQWIHDLKQNPLHKDALLKKALPYLI